MENCSDSGSWSDTYGRKFVLLCTLAICFIGDAITGINSLPIFFIGRIIYSVARHTDPLLKATITDMIPDKQAQTQAFNTLIAIPGMAFIIGPILGGILHNYYGSFAGISGAVCSIDVVLIAIVYMFLPDIKMEKKKEDQKTGEWKKFLDLLSIKFAIEVAYNFLFMNSGLILTKKYLFTRSQIGFAIAYMSITMMIGAVASPHISKRFYANDTTGTKRIFHSIILMVASFTTLLVINSGTLYLAIFLPTSLAKILLETSWMVALTARTSESEKGFMIGVASSMMSAAGLVCPLISGFLGDYVDFNFLLKLPITPAIVGTILAYKIQKIHAA